MVLATDIIESAEKDGKMGLQLDKSIKKSFCDI